MSQKNVEVIRMLFEAYRRGDYDAALECLAPDVHYETGQEIPADGRDAVRTMWERWEGAWDEIETVPEEFIDAGDRVVVTVRYLGKGRGSGITYKDLLFDVYTLRDGLCVHKKEFRSKDEALAAAGLSRPR
jgi:ketosteroid isomerase-like protein